MINLLEKAKAIVAFVAAEGAFMSAHGLSAEGHWVTHVASVVLAALVYFVPNAKKSA